MIQEISAFACEKLPHGLLLLSQVYLISRKFLVCCHDFIPGLTLHMGGKREQNISTLTCSPLALRCVKYGKNTQASLKSCFLRRPGMPLAVAPPASQTTVLSVWLWDAWHMLFLASIRRNSRRCCFALCLRISWAFFSLLQKIPLKEPQTQNWLPC